MDGSRSFFVRRKPGQHKRDAVAFRDGEIRHRGQIFAARFNRRAQDQGIGPGDRFEPAVAFAHPGNDVAVIEPDDQLHLHPHAAAQAFDDADDVRIFSARRHEIDQPHRAFGRFDFRFEDQRVTPITAARRGDFSLREKSPSPIFPVAQERGEAGARIEARKAKPIHATIAADERPRLRVAQECVIFDFHFGGVGKLQGAAICNRRPNKTAISNRRSLFHSSALSSFQDA